MNPSHLSRPRKGAPPATVDAAAWLDNHARWEREARENPQGYAWLIVRKRRRRELRGALKKRADGSVKRTYPIYEQPSLEFGGTILAHAGFRMYERALVYSPYKGVVVVQAVDQRVWGPHPEPMYFDEPSAAGRSPIAPKVKPRPGARRQFTWEVPPIWPSQCEGPRAWYFRDAERRRWRWRVKGDPPAGAGIGATKGVEGWQSSRRKSSARGS